MSQVNYHGISHKSKRCVKNISTSEIFQTVCDYCQLDFNKFM